MLPTARAGTGVSGLGRHLAVGDDVARREPGQDREHGALELCHAVRLPFPVVKDAGHARCSHRRPGVHHRRGRHRARRRRRHRRRPGPARARARDRAGEQQLRGARARCGSTTCSCTGPCSSRSPCTPTCCRSSSGCSTPGASCRRCRRSPSAPTRRRSRSTPTTSCCPIPKPHPPTVCNTMWAITDFTEENGATRIIPGSHLRDHDPNYGEHYDSHRSRDAEGQRADLARVAVARRRRQPHDGTPRRHRHELLRRLHPPAGEPAARHPPRRPSRASRPGCASSSATGSTTCSSATSTDRTLRSCCSTVTPTPAWCGTRSRCRRRTGGSPASSLRSGRHGKAGSASALNASSRSRLWLARRQRGGRRDREGRRTRHRR